MKYILFLFLSFYSHYHHAQTAIQLRPSFGGEALELEKEYERGKEKINFSALRFYLSDVKLLQGNKTVYSETQSYHLIDAEVPSTLIISLKNAPKKYNKIAFNIGIDSLTNVSGAMGGDLDPTKGMYWTWQNGYINFKLEGFNAVCNTRNHFFQYHLGGYQPPFATLQPLVLAVKSKTKTLLIDVAVDKFLEGIDMSKTAEIMSPSAFAVELSRKLKGIFSVIIQP